MASQTNEEALESCIESSLLEQGFVRGENKDFNKDYAIDEKRFWDFLESTQSDELEKLKRENTLTGQIKVLEDSKIDDIARLNELNTKKESGKELNEAEKNEGEYLKK